MVFGLQAALYPRYRGRYVGLTLHAMRSEDSNRPTERETTSAQIDIPEHLSEKEQEQVIDRLARAFLSITEGLDDSNQDSC